MQEQIAKALGQRMRQGQRRQPRGRGRAMPNGGLQAPGGGVRELQAQERNLRGTGFSGARPALGEPEPEAPGIKGYEAPSKLTAGRLEAGTIDQSRANQTAEEQGLLEKAFGPEWRTHVFGGRGIVAANNKAIAGGGGSGQENAFHEQLMKDRRRALERAAQKLGGISLPGGEPTL